MATSVPCQSTLEEKLIWSALIMTYPVYLVGGLYITGSVLAWLVLLVLLFRHSVDGRPLFSNLPIIIWIWIVCMLVLLFALIIAHMDRDLGVPKTIKSSIGWAKGWALLAIFIFLGSQLSLRRERLVRGCCVIAGHSLIFAFGSLILFLLGFRVTALISPLSIVGGPSEAFFAIALFELNPETGMPRWRFFAPWAPAAGLLSCVYLVICSQEKSLFWRRTGCLGAMVICILCQSRVGWVIFFGLMPIVFFPKSLFKFAAMKVYGLMLVGVAVCGFILVSAPLQEMISDFYQQMKDARPDSSRVRKSLANIAVERWQSEAPIWGHGNVERGPKIVEFMPIGSHHSWYGLLFIKGLVGAVSFAFAMLCTFFYLLFDLRRNTRALPALLLLMILFTYSFFENLEMLVYLYWPAMLFIGMALNPVKEEVKSNEYPFEKI